MSEQEGPRPLLTKAAIVAAQDLTTERVEVPEWGGAVLVKALKGSERSAWEQSITVKRRVGREVVVETKDDNLYARFCQRVMVNEDGTLMFSEDEVAALAEKSSAALARVFRVGLRLSGMDLDDYKLEEQVKN